MIICYDGKPGEGMQLHRNRDQWTSIADFLSRQNFALVMQSRAAAARGPACGGGAAVAQAAINFGGYGAAETSPVPVSNTGTTLTRGDA